MHHLSMTLFAEQIHLSNNCNSKKIDDCTIEINPMPVLPWPLPTYGSPTCHTWHKTFALLLSLSCVLHLSLTAALKSTIITVLLMLFAATALYKSSHAQLKILSDIPRTDTSIPKRNKVKLV